MLNKLGSNLLLIAAVTCAPLLLLQGIWLAAQATASRGQEAAESPATA